MQGGNSSLIPKLSFVFLHLRFSSFEVCPFCLIGTLSDAVLLSGFAQVIVEMIIIRNLR